MTTTLPPITREKRLKTNLNQKLNCLFFCHIELGRSSGITESAADATTFRFITEDGSHPPVLAKVMDSCRQPLCELSSVLIRLSHSMTKDEFIKKVLTEVKGSTTQTEMVTYFYQKQ